MAANDKAIYITRAEFYSAQAVLWLYIFLALSAGSVDEGRWSLGLRWAALGMAVINAAALTFLSRRSKATKDKPTPPASGSMN
jgi:hypothetical protein